MDVGAAEPLLGISSPVTACTTSGPVRNMYEMPRTMNTKSVSAGEYAAPPAQGPSITLICGMTPDARTFRRNIPPYPASAVTPSWMRAPAPSLRPISGAPTASARSITL